MYTTRATRLVRAPANAVYAALVDPELVARWRFPDGMTCTVHDFEPTEGGRFRVSLHYADPSGGAGKSSGHTDTYHGHFVRLVPNTLVVEVSEFETEDPALFGEMTMTTRLTTAVEGVLVEIVHEGVPDAIAPDANETGTRMALARLAELVE